MTTLSIMKALILIPPDADFIVTLFYTPWHLKGLHIYVLRLILNEALHYIPPLPLL